MYNSSKFKNIWEKYNNYISLITLITIVGIITYYRVLIQIYIGPISDTCDFLSNALVFAGQDMGYSDLTRPPFFSFLLSIPFRMGYVSTTAIFVLDGIMYLFGVIGLYFLLKLRFNSIWSFLGSLLFATFPYVLIIVGFGFSDLASVSLTIWTFYFLILAVKRDSKFFYLVFPFAMLAFLARYNSALITLPLSLYILMNRDKIKNTKNIFTGIFISLLLLIPVFAFFLERFNNMIYPFMTFFGISSTTLSSGNAAYNSDLLFFIKKIPLAIGLEGCLTILIIIAGFLIYGFFKLRKNTKKEKKWLNVFHIHKKNMKIKLALFIVLTLIFIGSFSQISVYFSEILFFILSYLFYDLAKNLNIKDLDLHLLIFAWFMTFFIFHSVFAIKVDRYFVLMAPAVAYFLILGINEISNKLEFKIKNYNIVYPLIAVILTIVILLSAASSLQTISQVNNSYKITNEKIITACEWFTNYDPDYKHKIIYSDIWPYFGWYLKTDVKPMPEFKGNQKFYGGVTDHNITLEENNAYNQELENNNAYYYFCNRPELNLTSYKPINRFGKLIIYQRIV